MKRLIGVMLALCMIGVPLAFSVAAQEQPETGDLLLNGEVRIIEADIQASNGVIHVIDAVLIAEMPEMAATDEVAVTDEAATNLTDVDMTNTAVSGEINATNTAVSGEISATNTALNEQVSGTSTAINESVEATGTALVDNLTATPDASAMTEEPMATEEAGAMDTSEMTIADILQNDPQFSTLVAALEATGLLATLQDAGPFTVFAPTDAAFEAYLEARGADASALLTDTDALTEVLLYHVAYDELLAADLVDVTELVTVNGAAIVIRLGDDSATMDDMTEDASATEDPNATPEATAAG